MKKSVFAFLILVSVNAISQTNNNTDKKWILGFGINIIDNSGASKSQFVNPTDNWNTSSTISKLSIEKHLGEFFAAELSGSFNQISSRKLQNGNTISQDFNYLGFDLNGKFYFDEFIFKKSPINAYLLIGVGAYTSNKLNNQSGNTGIGLAYWIQPNIGIRLQTVGKYAFDKDQILNNHIQHSAEIVIRF